MATSVDPGYEWSSLKPMPTKRVFVTAVGVENDLFLLGGCDARGEPLSTVESLNMNKRKQWNRLMTMPTPRAGISAVTVGSKILTFGGVGKGQHPTDCVEIYDLKSKKWDTGDCMTAKLLGVSAVVRDSKAYVFGGMGTDTNPTDHAMVYDVETDRWANLERMPTPRYATFSFLVDDCLYVVGGRQGKLPVAALERYDFREGKWKTLPDIPSKRVFALYTASNDHIYSVGGLYPDGKKGFADCTEVFDIRNETWMLGSPMVTKRGDFAIGFQGGKVIAAGGLGNGGKPMNEVECYDQAADTWSPVQSMPNAHCSCGYTLFNEKLVVGGGLTMGGPSAAVEILSNKNTNKSLEQKKS